MLRSTWLRQNLWTRKLQNILELFLHLPTLNLLWTFHVTVPGNTSGGQGVGAWGVCRVSRAASHSQHRLQPLSCLFCLGRLDELLEIAPFLIIVDFSKTSDTYFSFCWIKDAANGSWFTSDWMDLAEWFNSSPAAGCRKILSHFTERMFSLSFLVITYLHELAQLGGSGGSCVAPSVCISYHWFGGQIIKPRIT